MLTFSNMSADAFESSSHRGAGRKRPRHREALSCWQCRNRKIRCDRKSPCQQCQTRGLPLDCFYSLARESRNQGSQISEPETPGNDGQSGTSSKPSSATASATPSISPREMDSFTPAVRTTTEINVIVKPPQQQNLRNRRHVKAKLIGRTNWRVPCNDLAVLKAMLEKTDRFAECRKEFGKLKTWVKVVNAVPPSISTMASDDNGLASLLPDHKMCEQRLVEYCQSYGQIYDFIDETSLTDALVNVYTSPNDINPVEVSKLILVVAIAMQSDETERLNGQKLARCVEHCYHSSASFQKPCIGTVQTLLLLVIMRTIASSETDKMYSILGVLGLATQATHSISLHRDPELFGVNPYFAETRRRLWACFFRLNLEYCIRSGTSLALRLEEIDCPLPSDVNINTLSANDRPPQSDPAFAITAAKLARITAPVQQAICPMSKAIPPDLLKDVREAFKALQLTMPSYLKPGADTANEIQKIQQSLIISSMNTILLIISSQSVSDDSSNSSQRSNLLDSWDNAIAILDVFQSQSQYTPQRQCLFRSLLWSDICRAAFTASTILEKLRNIECDSTMSARPQHTLHTFHGALVTYLTDLTRFWLDKSHRGPVAAKICLLLGLTQSVTCHLLVDFPKDSTDPSVAEKLLSIGVAAATQTIADMKQAVQNQSNSLAFTTQLSETCSSGSGSISNMPTLDVTLDDFWGSAATAGKRCGEDDRGFRDPFGLSDTAWADPMISVDFVSSAEDFSMSMPSVEPSSLLNDVGAFPRWAEGVQY